MLEDIEASIDTTMGAACQQVTEWNIVARVLPGQAPDLLETYALR